VRRGAVATLAVAALAVTAGAAAAQPTAVLITPASKKSEYLSAKALAAASATARAAAKVSPHRPGKPPPTVISVYNTWTHEWLAIDADPRAPLPAAETVDAFLRCHFTNQPADMDRRLAKTLRAAALHFGSQRIEIVSGFRAPKYNLMLRKKGREVARDSQHTHGNAVDFRIPGVDVRELEAWARRLHMGGVGLYLNSGFIHIDTGRVRYWKGT
jgi:uncharacterized protein YcbK (DUF882 family)